MQKGGGGEILCDLDWCVHEANVQNKWDGNTHTTRGCVTSNRAPAGDNRLLVLLSLTALFHKEQKKRKKKYVGCSPTLNITIYISINSS